MPSWRIAAPVEHVLYEMSSKTDLGETVRQVEALGRRIVTRAADVRDLGALSGVVDRGIAQLGRLDIIVANAGVDITVPWDKVTPEILRTTIDINLIGVWNTVMAGVRHLVAVGVGSIILTSSANGLKAGPWQLPYNMAKFGVTAMAKSFAMELAKDHVRVSSGHPGGVNTKMAESALPAYGPLREENPILSGIVSGVWTPGMTELGEVSNAVLWLASDQSKWVTGHALAVDGGMSVY